MGLGDSAGFIIASYLVSFAVIVGAILFSIQMGRKVRRQIAELEARGIRRRSDRTARPATGTATAKPGSGN